jgi:pentose-5-phosphate-3-epimerase
MRKGRGNDIQGACGQLRIKHMREFEITASLDPAVMDNNLENYLADLNKTDGVSIHLDIMRKSMVGHDHCTDEQIDWILKNAKKPVDMHIMSDIKDAKYIKQSEYINEARSICAHEGDDMIAYSSDKKTAIVMSVKPGLSGQSFMPDALDRIKALREANKDLTIIVDGGINDKNIAQVKSAGANIAVVGNYLYSIYKLGGQKQLSQGVSTLSDIVHK